MRNCLLLLPPALLFAGLACEEEVTPPPPDPGLPTAAAAVSALERAYAQRDLGLLAALLSSGTGAEFRFILGEPSAAGDTAWTRDEFLRRHQRLFDPEHPPPNEPPTPPEIWLLGLSLTFVPLTIFQEREDFYSQDGGLDGKLDPQRWRVSGARYGTRLFFELSGDTDYRVDGESNFVVIEDRTAPGRFLLYRWEEICGAPLKIPPGTHVEPKCIGQVLALYP